MHEKETHITVVVKEPGQAPRVEIIANTLEAFQEIIGGTIDIVRDIRGRFEIVCADDFWEMPSNIYLASLGILLCGTIFMAAPEVDEVHGVRFRSLTDEEQNEAVKLLEAGAWRWCAC